VLAQDQLLGDRYRLTSRIAIGGMGEVWRAADTVLNRTVAVKVLKSELTSDPTFLARFRAEAQTTAALSHPGIANVFDYGEAVIGGPGGLRTAYLVMEHVDGEPLSAILAREVRLTPQRTLDIIRQAATALDVAHRTGIAHRDVKPGNLLVRPDGVVKVTDFGIARVADSVPLTQSGMVVGTAQYFSPEQAEGRAVTAASDVYSLGVVAYECLAGRLPFMADTAVAVAVMQIRDTPPPLPSDVPPTVRELVARAMAKDPRLRYGTGGEFAAAVRAVQERPYDNPAAVVPVPLGGAAPGPMPPHTGFSPAAPAPPPTPAPGYAAVPAPAPSVGPAPAGVPAPSATGGPAPGPGYPSRAGLPPQPVGHAGPQPVTGFGAQPAPPQPAPPQSAPPQSAPPQPAPPQPAPSQPAPSQSSPQPTPAPQPAPTGPPGPPGPPPPASQVDQPAQRQGLGVPPAQSITGYVMQSGRAEQSPSGQGMPAQPGTGFVSPQPYPPAQRRSPRWPIWVAALVVLALAAAGVITLLRSGHGDSHTNGNPRPTAGQGAPTRQSQPTAGPTEQPPPPGQPTNQPPQPTAVPATSLPADTANPGPTNPNDYVNVSESDYVEHDVTTVMRQLAELGLRPVRVDVEEDPQRNPGTVVNLDPSGMIRVGNKITVYATPGRGSNR
jgi:serine/threonine protein kinase